MEGIRHPVWFLCLDYPSSLALALACLRHAPKRFVALPLLLRRSRPSLEGLCRGWPRVKVDPPGGRGPTQWGGTLTLGQHRHAPNGRTRKRRAAPMVQEGEGASPHPALLVGLERPRD